MPRVADGSAGDVDYAAIGSSYTDFRQPDPRIARSIEAALGDAHTVLNVGAGAGAYEPDGRDVVPLEPSAAMRAKRPPSRAAAVDGVAESLPFATASFDASMSTFSVHQWADVDRGLMEMRRVTRGPVVILTCDPARVHDFWLARYVPSVLDAEARRYPEIRRIGAALGGVEVESVAVPFDCRDGFNEAYFGRPEMFLRPEARLACSAWSFVDASEVEAGLRRLADDLASGTWDARFGALRRVAAFDGSLRLVVSRPFT